MNKTKWKIAYNARKWMRKNEPFLDVWHAYVGHETGLFLAFENTKTVEEVAEEKNYPEDLLRNWVDVGVALKHLRKRPNDRYRTSKSNCGEFLDPDTNHSVGALLKEMMELHVPTILKFPALLNSEDRVEFDHSKFGLTVAETSAILERFSIKRIHNMVNDSEESIVLDIGCGSGGYVRALADRSPNSRITGYDLNPDVILEAKEKSKGYENVSFETEDILNMDYQQDPASLILVHNLLHYISPDKRVELIGKIASWLKVGGKISIMTPLYDGPHGKAFASAFNTFFTSHSNLYGLPTLKNIQRYAEQSGLQLVETTPLIREGAWYMIELEKK
ncbi:class I SAM-dependent methyltransferase [Halalkalibacillus sediminis]|nr:class I SAM-dependent methyltransferase [Halalkalibacillus sediminis]